MPSGTEREEQQDWQQVSSARMKIEMIPHLTGFPTISVSRARVSEHNQVSMTQSG
jgi:hypothetical protein